MKEEEVKDWFIDVFKHLEAAQTRFAAIQELCRFGGEIGWEIGIEAIEGIAGNGKMFCREATEALEQQIKWKLLQPIEVNKADKKSQPLNLIDLSAVRKLPEEK